ncbi:hypothetical protein B0T25DRAFT_78237 [Lasiosphaeria hispida]|uniref:Uncharacterized protein n=1 Tax=Lasiosphaeria hispida TaxID=260671 RepID=A0AAJ0MHD7_9PEZI|nr:hypothetical protein B0T25DRAFT_78237 [Lasiosphaeria hispida]
MPIEPATRVAERSSSSDSARTQGQAPEMPKRTFRPPWPSPTTRAGPGAPMSSTQPARPSPSLPLSWASILRTTRFRMGPPKQAGAPRNATAVEHFEINGRHAYMVVDPLPKTRHVVALIRESGQHGLELFILTDKPARDGLYGVQMMPMSFSLPSGQVVYSVNHTVFYPEWASSGANRDWKLKIQEFIDDYIRGDPDWIAPPTKKTSANPRPSTDVADTQLTHPSTTSASAHQPAGGNHVTVLRGLLSDIEAMQAAGLEGLPQSLKSDLAERVSAPAAAALVETELMQRQASAQLDTIMGWMKRVLEDTGGGLDRRRDCPKRWRMRTSFRVFGAALGGWPNLGTETVGSGVFIGLFEDRIFWDGWGKGVKPGGDVAVV